MEPTTTITVQEYNQLLADSAWLSDLEAAGVDNWQGIEEAYSLRTEREETALISGGNDRSSE